MRKQIAAASLALLLSGIGVAGPASATNVATSTPTVVTAVKCSGDLFRTKSKVNLRAKPSKTATVKKTIPAGTCLNVLDVTGYSELDGGRNTWFKVSYKGATGWVLAANLSGNFAT